MYEVENVTETTNENVTKEIIEDDVFAIDEPEEMEDEIEKEDLFEEVGVFNLINEIELDGKVVKKLNYDFGKISPDEYTMIVKKVSKKESVQIPELNMSVQFNLFARAVGYSAIYLKSSVKTRDFRRMCALARDFLLSEPEESDLAL